MHYFAEILFWLLNGLIVAFCVDALIYPIKTKDPMMFITILLFCSPLLYIVFLGVIEYVKQ